MDGKIFIVVLFLFLFGDMVYSFDQKMFGEYKTVLHSGNMTDVAFMAKEIKASEGNLSLWEKSLPDEQAMLAIVRLGILYHNISRYGAAEGYRDFIRRADAIFSKLKRERHIPKELRPFVLAYLGSARAITADISANVVTKVRLTREGIRYLNEAVNRYGRYTFLPHYIRGHVFSELPDMFKKEDQAMRDFELIERIINERPGDFDSYTIANVYYRLAELHKRRRDIRKALSYWRETVRVAPTSSVGKQAREQIKIFAE